MTRRYKDFLISHDGMQWVVQKEYMGKDKEKNDKLMLTSKFFFSKIESVAIHIGSSELVEMFNQKCKNVLDVIEIECVGLN